MSNLSSELKMERHLQIGKLVLPKTNQKEGVFHEIITLILRCR